ncbi:GNAT family N-acetyltransferase [Stenotrophomonas sepilia]|uniref:GNAT family N-acetyltransferase n=1 Tax=Stenotrophomonas sepilia TaxID=2860290 RepID=UPI002E76DDBD|nr:GNAT family N-acetyltransferase [Stenotrophomonas sepilia]
MDHRLQPVQPHDYALIAGWLDSAAATLRWAGPGVPYPLRPEQFEQVLQLRERSGWLLLAESGQRVGFGQAWCTEPGATHLGRLLVAPQARGRGLGRGLVEALIEQAFQSDAVERLTLRVYRDNAAAVALYRTLGFEPVDAASTPALLFMQRARR